MPALISKPEAPRACSGAGRHGPRTRGPLAAALALAAALVQLPRAAASDLSGSYASHGARLDVVDSPKRVIVIYRANPVGADDPASCDCVLAGEHDTTGPVKLSGPMEKAVLEAGSHRIVIEGARSACCALPLAGRDAFELESRAALARCEVRRMGAMWYALGISSALRDVYEPQGIRSTPGDVVMAVPDAPGDGWVPARRISDGRAGFLLRSDLDCFLPRNVPAAMRRQQLAASRPRPPAVPFASDGRTGPSEDTADLGGAEKPSGVVPSEAGAARLGEEETGQGQGRSAGTAKVGFATSSLPRSVAPADLSGRYAGHGARLDVVDSPSHVLVVYRIDRPAESDLGCECTLAGARKAQGTVKLTGAMDRAALRTVGDRLVVFEGDHPLCCGHAWPGRDAFEFFSRAALPRCRVSSGGASWYKLVSSAEHDVYEPEGSRCEPGEEVVAVPDAPDERWVPARRISDGRAGFLLRSDLDCLLSRDEPDPRRSPTQAAALPCSRPAAASERAAGGASAAVHPAGAATCESATPEVGSVTADP